MKNSPAPPIINWSMPNCIKVICEETKLPYVSFPKIPLNLMYAFKRIYVCEAEPANHLALIVQGVGEIVQVRAQYDLLLSERWNSIRMLSTCLHQC